MKPVQYFLGQMNGFLKDDFGSMRHRIPAATLPYTCRELSRNHCRIPSLNWKGYRLIFGVAMICDMSRNHRPLQGILMTLLNRGVA
jgi:hypothetical protein